VIAEEATPNKTKRIPFVIHVSMFNRFASRIASAIMIRLTPILGSLNV